MDINLALRAFIRTIERGSLSGAARDLSISQPAVSKHLRNLEKHVNARLIERNSKAIRPTAHGLTLYEASRSALASLEAALEVVRSDSGSLEGNLRVFAPTCIGSRHVQRLLMEFQNLHTDVTADLILGHKCVDLVLESFDVAVTYGTPQNQDLIVRRVGLVERILVAAPSYLRQLAPIQSPADLSQARIITIVGAHTSRDLLALRCKDEVISCQVNPVLVTNDAHVYANMLVTGSGIGPVQVNLVAEELEAGKLVRVLPGYDIEPTDAFLAFPSTRYMRPVVRAFIDFMIPQLRKIPGIAAM